MSPLKRGPQYFDFMGQIFDFVGGAVCVECLETVLNGGQGISNTIIL